jgi:hypothetical protein
MTRSLPQTETGAQATRTRGPHVEEIKSASYSRDATHNKLWTVHVRSGYSSAPNAMPSAGMAAPWGVSAIAAVVTTPSVTTARRHDAHTTGAAAGLVEGGSEESGPRVVFSGVRSVRGMAAAADPEGHSCRSVHAGASNTFLEWGGGDNDPTNAVSSRAQ